MKVVDVKREEMVNNDMKEALRDAFKNVLADFAR